MVREEEVIGALPSFQYSLGFMVLCICDRSASCFALCLFRSLFLSLCFSLSLCFFLSSFLRVYGHRIRVIPHRVLSYIITFPISVFSMHVPLSITIVPSFFSLCQVVHLSLFLLQVSAIYLLSTQLLRRVP